MLGYHKRRIKTHAKLANDIDGVTLAFGVGLLELLAARVRNGAQIALKLFLGHANAVIGDGNGASIAVEGQANGKIALLQLNAVVGQALEVELVNGVGRIGNKLAQKDLFVGVNRIDHEVEQLFALGFELTHNHSSFRHHKGRGYAPSSIAGHTAPFGTTGPFVKSIV